MTKIEIVEKIWNIEYIKINANPSLICQHLTKKELRKLLCALQSANKILTSRRDSNEA